MYSIETKKRKFDRIVDTIKVGTTAPVPNPHSAPLSNYDPTTAPEISSLKKRRLGQPTVASPSFSMASLASAAEYLPSSREAFLDRLESFGPIIKWHVPSTEEVSAAAWAKRGWRCVDTDTVGCQACKEQLLVKIDDEEEAAAEAREQAGIESDDFIPSVSIRHRIMIDKYQDLIIIAHAEGCPWRARGCDETIQRLTGMLNGPNTLNTLHERYDGLKDLEIPTVYIFDEEPPYQADNLYSFTFSADNAEQPDIDKLRLAVCGWQLDPSREDVVECRACFRSLGLWMYRGTRPLLEKLDALDNHLEYCPWRSGAAQHTEITIEGAIVKVPAWALVERAIDDELRKRAGPAESSKKKQKKGDDTDGMEGGEMEEKERESKVSDLLRRVKDLRRPFKKLLRHKAKAV